MWDSVVGITLMLLIARSVGATTPWLNPYEQRCFMKGETEMTYLQCPNQYVNEVQVKWTLIPSNLVVGNDITFGIEVTGTTVPDVIESALSLVVCRESSYDCAPNRQGKETAPFRLGPYSYGQAFTNGTQANITIRLQYAERYTFVAAAFTAEMIYYVGVTRDVLSGQAMSLASVEKANCKYNSPSSALKIDMDIVKSQTRPGLQFNVNTGTNFLAGKLYQMHVHETGDTRSFANALGHLIGENLNPARKFEAGSVVNASLRLSQEGETSIFDPDIDFVGPNGILGRSVVFHDAADGSRVGQCAINPKSFFDQADLYAPIPDYDATVCIFDNGDVIQMEVEDPLTTDLPRIFVRYNFQNIQTADQEEFTEVYHLLNGTKSVVLAKLERGKWTGKFIWRPSSLKWYELRLGSPLVMGSTGQSCIISRADRSGAFFLREYLRDYSDSAVVIPATTSASCIIQPEVTDDDEGNDVQLGVVGQIVFTAVSKSFCTGGSVPASACMRMDYFLSGLENPRAAVTLRQFGSVLPLDEPIPLFKGLSLGPDPSCGDKPSCAKGVTPPSSVYQVAVNKPPSTASGVLFAPFLTLNGVNSIIGRAIYVHSTDEFNSTVVGSCVTAIDSISQLAVAPISTRVEDNPDRAVCDFASTESVMFGTIMLSNRKGSLGVQASIYVNHNGIMFFNKSVTVDVARLVCGPSPLFNIRTTFQMTDPNVLNTTVDAFGNVTNVGELFGRTIGLYSDIDDYLMTSCVVGLAPASKVPTSVPTMSPIPSPTLPGGQTLPPTLRPPPRDQGGSSMSLGSIFILAVLLSVIVAFVCLVGAGIKRRLSRQRENMSQEGIGGPTPWDYQVEMMEQQTAPLKPIKPSMARFTPMQDDAEAFVEHRDEEEQKTAAETSEATSTSSSPAKKKSKKKKKKEEQTEALIEEEGS